MTVEIPVQHVRFEQGHAGHRVGLGHAPPLDDPHPAGLPEPLDQRARHRRPAAQKGLKRRDVRPGIVLQVLLNPQHHGGHPGGEGDPLGLDQRHQPLRAQVGTGIGELGALGGGHERVPPGGGVEHRHDRHHVVPGGDVHGGEVGDDVHVGGPLRVGHPLGIPGGAGGVAEHQRRALRELRPGAVRFGVRDQILVGDGVGQTAAGGVGSHDDVGFHRLQPGCDRRQQPGEVGIDEDHLVFPVVDDVDQLVGEQPDVERVADPAGVGGGPVELVVTLVVPGESADRLSGAHPQFGVEGGGQASDPFVGLPVGGPGHRQVRFHGDDLLVGKQSHRPVVEGG